MKIIREPNITPEVLTRLKSHVYDVIGCCLDVHKELGPWLNEYIYQEALKVAFEAFRFLIMGILWNTSIIWISCVREM